MECSYSHAYRDSINIKQIEPTIKPFFFSFVIASQLCFLLLYSAFCSWDSAYDISIFTSGSILPSEDRAWERKTEKLEKEKRTPFCLLFWAFPLLASITIVAIAIVPSYSMSWTQGAAFPTGSDLVSFTSLPPHPIPLGLPSAPAPSTCLMHPTWAGDLFHPW